MDHDLILPRLFYADGGRVAAARARGRTANVVSSNVRVRIRTRFDASESVVRFSSYNKNPRSRRFATVDSFPVAWRKYLKSTTLRGTHPFRQFSPPIRRHSPSYCGILI